MCFYLSCSFVALARLSSRLLGLVSRGAAPQLNCGLICPHHILGNLFLNDSVVHGSLLAQTDRINLCTIRNLTYLQRQDFRLVLGEQTFTLLNLTLEFC